MTEQILKAWYEIVPEERNKMWINPVTVTFYFERFNKSLTVWVKYMWDKDTLVRNLKCWLGSLAHDFEYEFRTWDDGTPIERDQADLCYADLILMSSWEEDRILAERNYKGVRILGFLPWIKRTILQFFFGRPAFKPYVPSFGETVKKITVRRSYGIL